MNIRNILILSIFAIAIAGITIAPVNAKLNVDYVVTMSNKLINGKTNLVLSISSDIGMKSENWKSSISKRKAELKKVNKIVVKIKGHDTKTFKKPVSGWKINKYDYSFFTKSFSVKGNPKNKDYSIKLYDKKGKLLKNKKNKVLRFI